MIARRRGNGLFHLLALFRDNPISLRRFSIFTTSFVLTADSVADGHSKYSRNLVFTLAARGKLGGKDARQWGGKGKIEGEKRLLLTSSNHSCPLGTIDPLT